MADKLSDLNPLSVTFDPGERPADVKLDNWGAQIERGFYELEGLLGDLFHNQEANLEATYFTNLTRALGNLGDVQYRLPTTQVFTYRQTLSNGDKEQLLDFQPDPANPGAATFSAAADTSITPANFQADRNSLASAGDWTREGRLVLTRDASNGSTVDYDVDPSVYFEHYGTLNGPNVVPSLAQIQENYNGGFNDLVASIADNGNKNYTITLPEIHYWYDRDGTLVDFNAAVQGATPRYEVPLFFSAAVLSGGLGLVNGSAIPTGLIQLWFLTYDGLGNITDIQPIRNTTTNDPITYEYENLTSFHVQLPSAMAPLTVPANPARNYVVTFGGQGIGDFLRNLYFGLIEHDHSGSADGSLVSHESLADRFNPARGWTHSAIATNPHPQYLMREGVQTDARNGGGSMLGHLHLASEAVGGPLTDPSQFDNFAADRSFKLRIGPSGTNAGIFYERDGGGTMIPRWTSSIGNSLWLSDDATDLLNLYLGTAAGDATNRDISLDVNPAQAKIAANSIADPRNVVYAAGALWAQDDYVYFTVQEDPPYQTAPGPDVNVPNANSHYLRWLQASTRFEFFADGSPADLHAGNFMATDDFQYVASQTGYLGLVASDFVPDLLYDGTDEHVECNLGDGGISEWQIQHDDNLNSIPGDKRTLQASFDLPAGAIITDIQVRVNPDDSGHHTVTANLKTQLLLGGGTVDLVAGPAVNSGTAQQSLDFTPAPPLATPLPGTAIDKSTHKYILVVEYDAGGDPLTTASTLIGAQITYTYTNLVAH